ncbi:MAG: hypothetical protein KF799_04025 [Bdellovibrionales bacterium]|nr:hypothetical protein [Bdellovibrionales bacterium]
MDLHQVRWALLKISVLVLAGTTWVFSGFILESRPEEDAAADPISQLVRLPASLPSQLPQKIEKIPEVFGPAAKPPEPVKMDVVRLPCWDRQIGSEQKVEARWVRLVGKACQSDFGVESVTVRNQANGYMGTVFEPGESSSLTTDYIPLESGKNEIVIRFEPEPGVKLETQVFLIR